MKSTILAASVVLTLSSISAQADMRIVDRRLFVATTGIGFDPGQADAALSAGANVNARNDAMDDATLLILAVKSFAKPEAVQWLIAHGANPSLRDKAGKSALDWANQLRIGRQPEGMRVEAAMRAAANGGAAQGTLHTQYATPQPAISQAPQAYTSGQMESPAAAQPASSAMGGGAIIPGVYECLNQQAMATMMSFGIIDGSTFMNSSGRRARYTYDANSATLTLESGSGQARYKRINATLFRPIRENGELGGFTCPLNRSKSPSRPPW